MKLAKEHKEQIDKVAQKIKDRTGWDLWKVQLWMSQTNPHMGDLSPSEAVLKGKFESVWKFIEDGVWKT